MSALEKLIERQANGEKLTSLEFAVFWCTDRVCAENAAEELAALCEAGNEYLTFMQSKKGISHIDYAAESKRLEDKLAAALQGEVQ